jgi:anaerobic ribonucleoside-triphosphate reductase activating protein
MNIKSITYPDVNNGLGCRVTLWCCGCTHYCPLCHNQELWDKTCGRKFTDELKQKLFDILELPYIKGLTLSGGDPLAEFNRKEVIELCREIKEKFPQKDIWLYTGYSYLLHIMPEPELNEVLRYIDYLVDGEFEFQQRDISLKFRGSSNQLIWQHLDGQDYRFWVQSELNN